MCQTPCTAQHSAYTSPKLLKRRHNSLFYRYAQGHSASKQELEPKMASPSAHRQPWILLLRKMISVSKKSNYRLCPCVCHHCHHSFLPSLSLSLSLFILPYNQVLSIAVNGNKRVSANPKKIFKCCQFFPRCANYASSNHFPHLPIYMRNSTIWVSYAYKSMWVTLLSWWKLNKEPSWSSLKAQLGPLGLFYHLIC